MTRQWKFLFTRLASYKKAANKNKSPKMDKIGFVVIDGECYAECLKKAIQECSFKEIQLVGARPLFII